jgi:hypothetical protein
MLRSKLLAGFVAYLLLAAYARGDTALFCGPPQANGTITISLTSPNGTTQTFIVPIKKGITKEQKALDIQKFVHDSGGDDGAWDASNTNDYVTFTHKEGGKVRKVNKIRVVDKSQEDWSIGDPTAKSVKLGAIMDFGLDGTLPAAGVDDDGNPSFVTVETLSGSITLGISPGDAAEELVGILFLQLQQAGADIHMTSPTSFTIRDPNPNAFIASQCTDNDLPVSGGAEFFGTVAADFSLAVPTAVIAGRPFAIGVTALDLDDCIVPLYQGTVTFASSDGFANLPPDYNFVPADEGSHQFQAVLFTPGQQFIGVFDQHSFFYGNVSLLVLPGE